MIRNIINKLKEFYCFEKINADEYNTFKVSGLTFNAEGYELKDLGHLSIMEAKGMFGLMKMKSIIISPTFVDMPILSIDRIIAFGKDTLYMEQFHTCLKQERQEERFKEIKEKYQNLNDVTINKNWYDHLLYDCSIYKKVSKKDSLLIDRLIDDYFNIYLELLKNGSKCDVNLKREKNREYSNGLVENGGPATDAFLKSWGKEKTLDYFNKVLFG